jgi:hypothetical protein
LKSLSKMSTLNMWRTRCLHAKGLEGATVGYHPCKVLATAEGANPEWYCLCRFSVPG